MTTACAQSKRMNEGVCLHVPSSCTTPVSFEPLEASCAASRNPVDVVMGIALLWKFSACELCGNGSVIRRHGCVVLVSITCTVDELVGGNNSKMGGSNVVCISKRVVVKLSEA